MKTFRILTHFIESQNSEQNFDVIESWYFDVFDRADPMQRPMFQIKDGHTIVITC